MQDFEDLKHGTNEQKKMSLFTLNITFGGDQIDISFDDKGFADFLHDYDQFNKYKEQQDEELFY